MYLIPCRLLTSHVLPTKKLLEPFPRLQELFLPLCDCIRRADLKGFDAALQKGEHVFVNRRIYLTLERGRDIALRNLLRKVFIAGGFEEPTGEGSSPVRRTRIPLEEFQVAVSFANGGERIDPDEVECFLANMIYKVHAAWPFSFYSPSPPHFLHGCRFLPHAACRDGMLYCTVVTQSCSHVLLHAPVPRTTRTPLC